MEAAHGQNVHPKTNKACIILLADVNRCYHIHNHCLSFLLLYSYTLQKAKITFSETLDSPSLTSETTRADL